MQLDTPIQVSPGLGSINYLSLYIAKYSRKQRDSDSLWMSSVCVLLLRKRFSTNRLEECL
jgi:hypothetical protein